VTTRQITIVDKSVSFFVVLVQLRDLFFREGGVDDMFDIVQGSRSDFVILREDVHFQCLQVDVDVMIFVDAVGICRRGLSSS
jgi:hypothetical protein